MSVCLGEVQTVEWVSGAGREQQQPAATKLVPSWLAGWILRAALSPPEPRGRLVAGCSVNANRAMRRPRLGSAGRHFGGSQRDLANWRRGGNQTAATQSDSSESERAPLD